MPATRVEQHDWSTNLCSVVILPEVSPSPSDPDPHSRQIDAMRAWLHDVDGPAQGLYQQTVYLTGPGADGMTNLRIVFRFTDPLTARDFEDRFR